MVRGLEIFRERFRRFEGAFVLIGGAACDQWFADNRLEFRATKDLDMVLIVEILNRDFVAAMRAFIEIGDTSTNPKFRAKRSKLRTIDRFPLSLMYPSPSSGHSVASAV